MTGYRLAIRHKRFLITAIIIGSLLVFPNSSFARNGQSSYSPFAIFNGVMKPKSGGWSLSMRDNKITSVTDPVNDQDAATKKYHDDNKAIPGGSNTYIQFNDGGVFGGDAGLVYNKTTDALTGLGDWEISKVDPEIKLTDTGDGKNTRITRSDTSAKTIRYNTVMIPGGDLGNALDFDGSDDCINLGDASDLDFDSDEPFSVSAWVKRGAISSNHIIASKMLSSGTFRGWWLHFEGTNNAISFMLRSDNATTNQLFTETDSAFTNTSVWYHIVITYDGSETAAGVNIYVDAVDKALTPVNDTLSATTLNSTSASIGSRNCDSRFYKGLIDEVVVWAEELSANDVSDLWSSGNGRYVDPGDTWPTDGGNIGTNLVAVWHHDESVMNSAPGGADTEDSSANTNHGTAEGGMTDGDFVTGKVSLPGTDTEVIVWESKDGVAAGEDGIHTFGAVDGGFVGQGQTLKFMTNTIQRGNVTNGGLFGLNQTTPLAMLHIVPNATTQEGQIIQGAASQTANLQEWWDSSETVLASVDDNGDALFRNLTIGRGEAGVDYTQTWDGETNNGVQTWKEDEAVFDFDSTINAEGLVQSTTTITASTYTATRTDYTILIDTTSNNVTVTLPNTGIDTGQLFYLKLINSANVGKITSSATIDDDGNDITLTLYESLTVQWDGSEYWVI